MDLILFSSIVLATFVCSDAFDGCLFDGRQYQKGDIITIPKCLGEMTCLGNYNLSPIRKATHGDCRVLRDVDGQSGCWFDGRVYAKGDVISVSGCLGELTCLGHNNYSPFRPATNCEHKREIDGQSGCLFDGTVYSPGDVITIGKCLARMTCLGHNNYGNVVNLGGMCPNTS